jgi:hypothetical protein
MAIRVRRGLKADFDPNKLLPGEPSSPLDSKELFIAFAPGDVKKIATYEDMVSNIEEANTEIIADLTSGANAVANVVEGILDGYNTMVDDTTGTPYTVKVDNGAIYLEEADPDPTPPVSETILDDIADLQTGKFDKANIVQTDTVNDVSKVASSAVVYAHGVEIDTINNSLAVVGTLLQTTTLDMELDSTKRIISGQLTLPAGTYLVTAHFKWDPLATASELEIFMPSTSSAKPFTEDITYVLQTTGDTLYLQSKGAGHIFVDYRYAWIQAVRIK